MTIAEVIAKMPGQWQKGFIETMYKYLGQLLDDGEQAQMEDYAKIAMQKIDGDFDANNFEFLIQNNSTSSVDLNFSPFDGGKPWGKLLDLEDTSENNEHFVKFENFLYGFFIANGSVLRKQIKDPRAEFTANFASHR